MNPYNHNPFKTDNNRVKNERDANRELAETARKREREELANIFTLKTDNLGFWK